MRKPKYIIRNYVAAGAISSILLAVGLLLTFTQALLQEKSELQAANERMQAELAAIAERVVAVEQSFQQTAGQTEALEEVTHSVTQSVANRAKLNLMQDPLVAHAMAEAGVAPVAQDPSFSERIDQSFAGLISSLTRIQLSATVLQDNIAKVSKQVLAREDFLSALPLMKPAEGRLSSRFGQRVSPTKNKPMLHKGLDIAGGKGREIYAPADGTVRFAGRFGGLGRYISLVHGHGFVTKYAHLHEYFVKNGDVVKRGDLIGTIGNTGPTTGPHLHYEVWFNDQAVDPERFIIEGLHAEVVGDGMPKLTTNPEAEGNQATRASL